jgi:GDPmannose 4,6-dehydratase
VAKLFAHWSTVNYRESYGIFAVSGILFNHESPLRGKEFVTRKITDAVAQMRLGKLKTLTLGNLDAQRDWGYAREYVLGMHLMMQHSVPETFVLATGKTWSVRKFTEASFAAIGIRLQWRGSGVEEQGVDPKNGKVCVSINPLLFRPAEVDYLRGNSARAKSTLRWEAKTTGEDLAKQMVEADIRRQERGLSY